MGQRVIGAIHQDIQYQLCKNVCQMIAETMAYILVLKLCQKLYQFRRYYISKFFKTNWPENTGPRRENWFLNLACQFSFLLLSESVLNFRRVTNMVDLGECLSLDADNLPSAVYLSTVQTPQPSSEGYFVLFDLESVNFRSLALPDRNTSVNFTTALYY